MTIQIQNFINRATDLVNSVPPCDGIQSQLAHALSEAINLLTDLQKDLTENTVNFENSVESFLYRD